MPHTPHYLLNFIKSISDNRFIFGKKSFWLNYISIENVVESIYKSMISKKVHNEEFILNTPIPLRRAANVISEELKKNGPGITLPYSLGYCIFISAEFLCKIFNLENKFLKKSKFFRLLIHTYVDGDYIKSIGLENLIEFEDSLKWDSQEYKSMNLI